MRVLLVLVDNTRVTYSTSSRGAASLIAATYGNPSVLELAVTETQGDGSVFWSRVWVVDDDRRAYHWHYDYETLKRFLLNGEDCQFLRNIVPEHDGRKTATIEQGVNAMWRSLAQAWGY